METVEMLKIQELMEKLTLKVESLNVKPKEEIAISSPETAEIAAALAKAQAEYTEISSSKVNPYLGNLFQDIHSLIKATRPALSKNGLCVAQHIISDDGATILYTILNHASGQWLKSTMRITPPKNDVQIMCSYTTTLKRLAYGSLVGIVMEDEDDDGEYAVATSRELYAKGTAINTKYDPKDNGPDVITKEQLDELEYELSEYPGIVDEILDKLRLQSLADLPKSKFMVTCTRIRKIKHLRNGTGHK